VQRNGRTDEVTGPSWADVPLAVKLTPLGALSLTSRAAVGALAMAGAGQLISQTCGSVVEVLVDELEGVQVSNCAIVKLFVGSQTYIVRGLGDVAERRWREPGDDLLNLDILSHDGGFGGICEG
jgi:hypothetical protein